MADATAGKKPPSLPLGGIKKPSIPVFTPTTPSDVPAQSGGSSGDLSLEEELEKLRLNPDLHAIDADDLEDQGTIGDGNFGTVHKMMNKKKNMVIAVKRVSVQNIRQDMREFRELSVSLKLAANKSPYIVDFYGYCLRDGDVWMCMELMDFSLEAVKNRVYHVLKERIPEDVIGKICVAVINALRVLQVDFKVMHRDIKPSNVVMNRSGAIKLCDFGLTGQLIDSIAKTKEIGCRPYMAPERIDPTRPSEGFTVSADVWSFGITMYEIAMGEFPYSKWLTIFDQLNEVVNGSPPKLPRGKGFSPEFMEVVELCLQKDPDRRPKYADLLRTNFLKTYDKKEVDVAGWLKKVMP